MTREELDRIILRDRIRATIACAMLITLFSGIVAVLIYSAVRLFSI